MIGVNVADCWYNSVIKCQQATPFGISRLVHGVIARNPRIALVSPGNMFPEINSSILEVFVIPESSMAGGVVRVPVLILATG
jgi:hypothetical protein